MNRYDPYGNDVSYGLNEGDGDFSLERIPLTSPQYRDIHTVKQGETLQSISFKYYGDSGRWVQIADLNAIFFPFEELKEGMQLYIP